MTNRQLLKKLGRGVNALDHADAPVEVVAPIVTNQKKDIFQLGQGRYNPQFVAQFQSQILKYFFTENGAGVYTLTNAAAILAANLAEALPVFMFANADFSAGYAKLQAQYPLQNWTYGVPVVFGKDQPEDSYGRWTNVVTQNLRKGDLVLVYEAVSGGTNYLALIVIRTNDVPYATLLDASNSNTFQINMLRYTVASTAATDLAQFANQILISNETMFGKFTSDPLNPDGFKNPEQQQENIIDIDLEVGINKEKGISTVMNYDAGNFRWNLFVRAVSKIV